MTQHPEIRTEGHVRTSTVIDRNAGRACPPPEEASEAEAAVTTPQGVQRPLAGAAPNTTTPSEESHYGTRKHARTLRTSSIATPEMGIAPAGSGTAKNLVGFIPRTTVSRIRRITRERHRRWAWDTVYSLYVTFALGIVAGIVIAKLAF